MKSMKTEEKIIIMKYNKIYLKITTVPNQEEIDINSREIEIFKSKYESHKNFLKDSDVELSYLNESAVNGTFGKVYSITLGSVHEGTPIVKTIYGEEKDLLDKLLLVLRQKDFLTATVVMYNRNFILSFLSKRLRKYAYPISMLPTFLQVYNKKSWKIRGSKCIQEYVKGISNQTENFEETCYNHNIDINIIDNSAVTRLLRKGKTELVHKNDISYIHALMLIDNQLSEEPEFGKLNSMIELSGKVEKEDINVLDHLLASGQLSSESIAAIVAFQKDSGEPAENVLTLVKTALSKTKNYQKVEEEDYIELKEALGLVVDYSRIQVVADKGNLGKKEADAVIAEYEKASKKVKKDIIALVEQFLTEKNKIGQKRAKESFDYLTEKLS